MYLVTFATTLKVLERLWMATSGNSDNKILLFNNNGPPESNRMLFWKITLTKNVFYKEKDLINKKMFYRKLSSGSLK